MSREDVVIFRLGKQLYGLQVAQVNEIIQMVAITDLPNLPAGVLGIINYRGQVIPLVDLRQMVGVPAAKIRVTSLIVVAQGQQGGIGLLVDAVEGVEALPLDAERQSSNNQYIKSIIRTDDNMILMVHLAALETVTQSVSQITA